MVTGNAGSEPATAVRDESAAEASERLGHRLIGPVIFWLAIVTAVIHLYFNTVSTLSELWSSALHFGLFGLICTLTTPMFNARSVGGQRMVLGVDVMLGLTALGCAFYLIIFEDDLYQRGFNFDTGDWIVSIVSVMLILELARRTVGWFHSRSMYCCADLCGLVGAVCRRSFQFPRTVLGDGSLSLLYWRPGNAGVYCQNIMDLRVHVYPVWGFLS